MVRRAPRLCALLIAAITGGAVLGGPDNSGLPIKPLIEPGYEPGADAGPDERGIWMEMAEAELELRRSPVVLTDGALTEYVRGVVCRVAGDYCPDVRLYVIRNPTFNASMAPNGVMLVHTGLIARAASTDQLASVIGHELAHYTQTHSIKRWRALRSRMTMGMLVSMGLATQGIAAGGLPEVFALATVMGFTRSQESEADELGAWLIAHAGYDPDAASELWVMLNQEEERASVKRPRGALFLSSHPAPERRAARLERVASDIDSDNLTTPAEGDPLLLVVENHYAFLMDEQVTQRDFGRLDAMIERHEAMGIDPGLTAFYRGEAWRLRGGAGDHEKAMAHYREATAAREPDPRAYRELGYLLYKRRDLVEAREHLGRYLALVPDASDRAMIEMYIEDGW